MKITGKHEYELPVSIEFEIASAPQPEGIEGLENIEPKALALQMIVNCRKLKKLTRTIKKDSKLLLRTLEKMKRHGWAVVDQERRGLWVQQPRPYDDEIMCSECFAMFNTIDNCTEKFDYCPSCGAKMYGEEDTEK